MPEGDTLFRAARTLHQALAGRVVTRFVTQYAQLAAVDDQSPLAGRMVEEVRSQSKHLLMRFSGGLTLHTHLRMNGSWHLYRPGERWQRSPSRMRVQVETDAFLAVGFDIPVAELLDDAALARHPVLRQLGPDLLSASLDVAEVLSRMRALPALALSEALLDQRLLGGIGNIYKSEVLFLTRLHPATPVGILSDETLTQVVETARKVMRANVLPQAPGGIVTHRGMRRTTGRANPEERLWVYGRGGKPCRRCGTTILCESRSLDARLTYWCPHCQPVPGTRSGEASACSEQSPPTTEPRRSS